MGSNPNREELTTGIMLFKHDFDLSPREFEKQLQVYLMQVREELYCRAINKYYGRWTLNRRFKEWRKEMKRKRDRRSAHCG